jgi:hypothetical protein
VWPLRHSGRCEKKSITAMAAQCLELRGIVIPIVELSALPPDYRTRDRCVG